MRTCCVEGCGLASKDVTLFEFPTSRLLRKRWVDAIDSTMKVSPEHVVCLRHFASDDYEDVRGKTRLKAKVVPSVFGPQELPQTNKDPLAESEESQESTSTHSDNRNGNDKDNGNVDSNDNINDTEIDSGQTDSQKHIDTNKNVDDGVHVDNGSKNIDADIEHVRNGDKNVDKHIESIENGEKIVHNDIENVDNGNENINCGNGNGNKETDKDEVEHLKSEKTETKDVGENSSSKNKDEEGRSTSEKITQNEHSKSKPAVDRSKKLDKTETKDVGENSSSKNEDEEGRSTSEKITQNEHSESKPVDRSKRVKKKWVPMREIPARIRVSEDSDSSQDSVNSDLPAPPILEDLEEHLPNYQIANMKTERQVAAMTATEDPPNTLDEDIEEMVIEPHVPVFIELSVGQDTTEGVEPANDCLMVVESVQCDIDPTLMLEARAEEDQCCELVDLDDLDDDDDDVVDTTELASPAPAPADKTAKKRKLPADPISLLTSSDEDDVIIQEPHVDTLSVSDETDEDDLPLQKLVKRENKPKKAKRSSKKAAVDVFKGVTDFYCMYCRHVSENNWAHILHVRTHSKDKQKEKASTRIYQICKECGYTTASVSQLHRHQRKHLNEKKYKCPLCSYRSKYNMSLLYHLKTHELDPNVFDCGACGVHLESKKDLLRHQKCCSEMDDKYACSSCGYVTGSRKDMKVHRSRIHKKAWHGK